MELLLLIGAYLVGTTVLGIAMGALISQQDRWEPVRPGRELTARASQPPNVGSRR
jgi:hypothetical protein